MLQSIRSPYTLDVAIGVCMAATSPPNAMPVLSIIVPTYRGGARIYDNLVRLDHALAALGETYEIIVVSDGDNDNTAEEAARLDAPHVHIYHYARNMGKGFALRYGVARSRGDIVTFIDGDGDIDPGQISTYLRIMRDEGADIVIASKRHPESKVIYPPLRRIYSATYQALLRILFQLEVRDTQVGLKLFRRDVLAAVLPRIVVKRYAFDLELLVVAHHLGYTRVVEAPVTIGQRFNSTINVRAILSVLAETAAIYYRRNVLRYYDSRHDVVSFETLSSYTEAELAAFGDKQHIALTILGWGIGRITSLIRKRINVLTAARLDGDALDDPEEEERHRASI